MSPLDPVPNNVPLVYPPSVDFFGFFENVFHWIVKVFPPFILFLKGFVDLLISISIPISVLFIIGIIYTVERLKSLRKKEEEIYDLKVEPAYGIVEDIDPNKEEDGIVAKSDPTLAKRWDIISQHMNSTNPNDWKQAILDADTILDDVLTQLGYRGESIGEKLKRAEPADFATINEAWEAHKARNNIAHGGLDFTLNEHEAKRIFQLYRKVFEEFYYI